MMNATPVASRGMIGRAFLVITAAVILALAAGCGEQTPAESATAPSEPGIPGASGTPPRQATADDRTWRALSNSDMTAAHRAQSAKAAAARDAMFGNLTRALMQAMGSAGPAGAIDACRIEAPAIATRTADERSVRIGRTSWKLRNPENVPPQWAHAFLDARPEEPTHALADDGTLGALLPIRMMSLCLTCHGEPGMIPADVQDELARLYPDDQATGFGNNDLRGWFWVEVPADI